MPQQKTSPPKDDVAINGKWKIYFLVCHVLLVAVDRIYFGTLVACFMQCGAICQENNTKCKKQPTTGQTNPAQINGDTQDTLKSII